MTQQSDVSRFAIAGTVSVPGDAAYDEAVSIFNGSIDRRPAIVASCTSADDVVASLAFAAGNELEVSVRGGGHNYAGFALCDGGLMIDLTPMNTVTVDPDARRAKCGGGATWGAFDAATQEHGLATPGGFISNTGVAGLTLGGGLGWFTRPAGLSCDNLVGAEVVTADGRVLRASADENPELLWAISGGGGNFGVVTEFEFALHPCGPLVALGLFFYAPDQGREMFRFAREFMRDLPDSYGLFLAGMSAPPAPFVPEEHHGATVFVIGIVGFGDMAEHVALSQQVTGTVAPLFDLVTPIPYVMLQQMFNDSAPWGTLAYEKAAYLDDLSDAAIDVIVEHTPRKTGLLSFVPIFVLGGAYASAGDDANAFGGSRAHPLRRQRVRGVRGPRDRSRPTAPGFASSGRSSSPMRPASAAT